MRLKKFAFGFAAAAVIGLASLTAPASASTTVQTTKMATPITDFSSQRYVSRRTVIRRGPVCTMRTVVRRGPYGRRVVTKTRVCR
jgi:hypothetical protein